MIFEAIQHILTPASPEAKAMGYVREAIAIEARYYRCRSFWASHLDKCRHHIIAAASELTKNSTIMVIGSGGLHDVPVTELLAHGHKLLLVDIVHLPRIRKDYGNHSNIRIIEQDVTGLAKPLYDKKPAIPENRNSLPEADLVISLNILSQLPINIHSFARKHKISLPDNFAAVIMDTHLNMLEELAPDCLVISDLERQYEMDKRTIKTEDALPDSICRRLCAPDDKWDWHIAPKGEADKNISVTHHVACWGNNSLRVK